MGDSASPDQVDADPRRWLPGECAVVLAFLAMPLPRGIGVLSLAVLAAVVLAAYMRYSTRLLDPLPILCIVLALWLALGLTSANVTSIEAGLLGLRLSLTFLMGVMLGYVWPSSAIPPFRVCWYCVVVFSALSIVVFLYFPQVEAAIFRGHGEYTASFAGESRLQGLWPSPAHASLAAVFLILASVRANDVLQSRALRWIAVLIGAYALYLTQVRVGILACIAGLALIAATSGSWGDRLGRLLALAIAGLCLALALSDVAWRWVASYPALASLSEATTDTRFLGRVEGWQRGLDMLASSPVVGWGPGSAGSTLGALFPVGGHVTPHSPYLKYAVEGGLPALLLFLSILWVLVRAVLKTKDYAKVGLAVLVPFFVTSITGSVVEAIPVSLVFAVVLGRYAGHARRRANNTERAQPRRPSERVHGLPKAPGAWPSSSEERVRD